jgi:hypothetical protein
MAWVVRASEIKRAAFLIIRVLFGITGMVTIKQITYCISGSKIAVSLCFP